ncbi:LysR family transcriptional regulator [Ideonella livida]|uniref:LysR family transcriptional regulator n=1 Tax=Ideonella livida TaxID=2707176 RepID=A0A7C9PF18_9BURK|nr:LysR family transcriptional regulator [Ideonella livida]NDY90195.1 LysR family transcriptional regulator [Ideonella livida]
MEPTALRLDDVALFVRVAELGSLSAAARERQLAVSQVTRALARLEGCCGLRLMHRSTHGLSLTDEGDTFLTHARQLLDTQAQLQAELTGKLGGPRGWVRVSVSPVLAEAVIAPSLAALHAAHPGLQLDICADDRIIDMARDGIDVALRTGSPASEALVARQIGTLGRGLYASPAYLARHGTPASVAALQDPAHRLIGNTASPVLNRWPLLDSGHPCEVLIRPHTRADNTAVVVALARHGAGIARITHLAARPWVVAGELVPVLHAQVPAEGVPMYAVMLKERHRLPKVRACIEHWAAWLQAAGAGPAGGVP